MDDRSASIFLAATPQGTTRVVRHGNDNWSVENPLVNHDVRCLAADPLKPSVVYAGTQGKGVLRSEDYGVTWKPAGLAGHIVKSIAVSENEPGTLYAGTRPARIYVSRDSGQTWSELEGFRHIRGRWYWLSPTERQAYVQGIALSPTAPNT